MAKNSAAGSLPEDENNQAQSSQGSIQSVETSPADANDVEDTEDGGAIVKVGKDAPADTGKFYDNLVPILPPNVLASIQNMLDERIREDKKAREDRDKQYAEGIKRTGLGNEAPGGANFTGASKVVHPMLIKAAIDFEARAIAELVPPAGVVKAFIPENGNLTQNQVDKARRVAAHMNWQLSIQMPEFRPELEQCLSQVPLGGSQFMYINWDEQRRRPTPTYWPSDDVYIPYGSSSALMAERITQVERITQRVYEARIKSKYYADPADAPSVIIPTQSDPAKAAEKVEGVRPDIINKDGLREIWRCYTHLEIEEDKLAGGELVPYVVEMNADLSGVKRVVRNWEKQDEQKAAMQWLVEFPFLPWRGALSIGLAHVIGSLSGAATGALRASLDSAHVNNFPAVLKLKGANFSGQTKQMEFGSFVEIEGGVGGINDDIRKLVMAVPYNPPNTVLIDLLGLLGTEGEGVVATTLKNLSEAASNTLPVGTTLALIEQGMKVYAGVHLRLLHAMTQFLRVLYRINRLYVTDAEIKDDAGTLLAMRQDYTGPMDVIPVADPNIFSDAQRFAQLLIVADRAQANPDLYDRREVETRILERTRIPDAKKLLQPNPQPEQANAVNENTAMAMGRPVGAFPEQDHLAHLQVHLDFANSPYLGQLPVIAPKFLPMVMDHLGQHIALWYASAMYHAGSAAVNQKLEKLMNTKDPDAEAELDKLLATLSPAAESAAKMHFGQYPQILGQLQQLADKYKPQQPADNSVGVAQVNAQTATAVADKRSQDVQATNQSREKVAQLSIVGKGQQTAQQTQVKAAADTQVNREKAAAAENAQRLKAMSDAALQKQKDDAAGERAQQDNLVKESTNQEDNQTAITIAAAELAGGHRSAVSTGTGINP